MKITTKYKHGDIVWVNVPNRDEPVPVEIYIIRVWNSRDIDYVFYKNDYARAKGEKYCYRTQEKAMANKEKERKDMARRQK